MSSSYLELPKEIRLELLTQLIAYQLVCGDLARATKQAEGEIAQNFLADAYQMVQGMTPESQAQVLEAIQKEKQAMRELNRPAIVSSVKVQVEQPAERGQLMLVIGAHILALRLAAEQIATLSAINGTTGELVHRLVLQGAELFQRCSPEELANAFSGIPGISVDGGNRNERSLDDRRVCDRADHSGALDAGRAGGRPMKMAKASEKDIDALRQFLLELEDIGAEGRFEAAEGVIRRFPIGWRRVVEGYEVLLQKACDPTLNYLEWKPEIRGLVQGIPAEEWAEEELVGGAVSDAEDSQQGGRG